MCLIPNCSDGRETNEVMKQVEQNQLRESIHKWLSPPDPSSNHNIACGTHHKKAATWFFEGNIYQEWKSKAGSGKSILCSTVIEDIKALCDAGQASMAYFYFDFRNDNKQCLRDLLPSLLTQLSARSSPRCDILSKLYSVHDDGKNQPSDSVLTKCLKDMLSLPGQRPIYLIMDALDESPTTSGIPSARERVLLLLKELVDLGLPNLHICVTSRPEIDIRNAIEPLTSLRVSLHDQTGQKEDIADYRWKKEDKEFVVKTLAERADGMFRWTFCQLEVLRDCLPSSVRRFLEELPESLDETYERDSRVVQFSHFSVKEYLTSERLATSSQDVSRYYITFETAHTILAQACVSVLLQLDDDDEQDEDDVQDEDDEQDEYEEQDEDDVHDEDDEQDDVEQNAPLAVYAAKYWVRHAQFEDVVSRIKGMEHLFDLDKPYFAAWRGLYDIDIEPPDGSVFYRFGRYSKSRSNIPLYYAALCGFAYIVEQLIAKHPQHVNAIDGYYMTPALAALAGRHFQVAQVLHRNKSSVEPRRFYENTPLHSAAYYGDLEMVQVLLEFGADVNSKNGYRSTPLGYASLNGHRNDARVARLLIAHGADPNTRNMIGSTTLHQASMYGRIEIVRLLIEHGANVEAKDDGGRTPLDEASDEHPWNVASDEQREEIIKLLSEHLAK
ncbi:ankyrin repeat-containing domain protein [Russula emetica]|nr:ankyrin repeat-containing domain protein [Russula emetica]